MISEQDTKLIVLGMVSIAVVVVLSTVSSLMNSRLLGLESRSNLRTRVPLVRAKEALQTLSWIGATYCMSAIIIYWLASTDRVAFDGITKAYTFAAVASIAWAGFSSTRGYWKARQEKLDSSKQQALIGIAYILLILCYLLVGICLSISYFWVGASTNSGGSAAQLWFVLSTWLSGAVVGVCLAYSISALRKSRFSTADDQGAQSLLPTVRQMFWEHLVFKLAKTLLSVGLIVACSYSWSFFFRPLSFVAFLAVSIGCAFFAMYYILSKMQQLTLPQLDLRGVFGLVERIRAFALGFLIYFVMFVGFVMLVQNVLILLDKTSLIYVVMAISLVSAIIYFYVKEACSDFTAYTLALSCLPIILTLLSALSGSTIDPRLTVPVAIGLQLVAWAPAVWDLVIHLTKS